MRPCAAWGPRPHNAGRLRIVQVASCARMEAAGGEGRPHVHAGRPWEGGASRARMEAACFTASREGGLGWRGGLIE